MQVVRNFSVDIYTLEMGLDKCAEIVLRRGRSVHSQNLILYFNEIKEPKQGKTYKYLGTEAREGVHQQMKERLKKEYTERLRIY
jgi:hypothetical protein